LSLSASIMRSLEDLLIVLSGEHDTLPAAEVKAILEAEGVEAEVLEERRFILRLRAPRDCCLRIAERASMVMGCYLELFKCPAEEDAVVETASRVDWSFLSGRSFAVRLLRKGGCKTGASTVRLEALIGGVAKRGSEGSKVDLRRPEVAVKGVIVDGQLYLGVARAEVSRGVFDERRPRRRPFFHPSALEPKLARLFVNLARARKGDLLFDPFAGTGSILMEAALIGCSPVGVDVDAEMVRGCTVNLRHYTPHAPGAVRGDARRPPIRRADCIATDPPYGRVSSTRGEELDRLLSDSLTSCSDLIPRGRCICLATPSWLSLAEEAEDLGLKAVEEHLLRVHKSLSRRIIVLRRP